MWSYAAIARITDDPKPEVDQLIRVITNEPNIWVRLDAAKAVAEIGSKASDAIPVLNAFAQEAFKSREILLAVSIQDLISRLRDNIADVSPAFKPSIIQTNGGF